MKINIQQNKMLASALGILTLSRTVRQIGAEVSDVERNLRGLSCLEACRHELVRQQEGIELLTGRLVNLATALSEITESYDRAEARNEQRMEDAPPLRAGYVKGRLFRGTFVHQKVLKILGK